VPLQYSAHERCVFTAGSLYCIRPGCRNPHHREPPPEADAPAAARSSSRDRPPLAGAAKQDPRPTGHAALPPDEPGWVRLPFDRARVSSLDGRIPPRLGRRPMRRIRAFVVVAACIKLLAEPMVCWAHTLQMGRQPG